MSGLHYKGIVWELLQRGQEGRLAGDRRDDSHGTVKASWGFRQGLWQLDAAHWSRHVHGLPNVDWQKRKHNEKIIERTRRPGQVSRDLKVSPGSIGWKYSSLHSDPNWTILWRIQLLRDRERERDAVIGKCIEKRMSLTSDELPLRVTQL